MPERRSDINHVRSLPQSNERPTPVNSWRPTTSYGNRAAVVQENYPSRAYETPISKNATHARISSPLSRPSTSRRPELSPVQHGTRYSEGSDWNVSTPASKSQVSSDPSARLRPPTMSSVCEGRSTPRRRPAPPIRQTQDYTQGELDPNQTRPRTASVEVGYHRHPERQSAPIKPMESNTFPEFEPPQLDRDGWERRERENWKPPEIKGMSESQDGIREQQEWGSWDREEMERERPRVSRLSQRLEQNEMEILEQELEERKLILELEEWRLIGFEELIQEQRLWEEQELMRLHHIKYMSEMERQRQAELRLQEELEREHLMALRAEKRTALELERRRQENIERQHRADLERQRLAALERHRQAEKEREEKKRKGREEWERRRKKKEVLRQVGVHVDVRRVKGGSLVWGGNAIDLSPAILTQVGHVKDNFLKNLPNFRIIKIEYVMNDALYKIFNDTKAELRKHGRSTKEMLLFHGTNPQNVDKYFTSEMYLTTEF